MIAEHVQQLITDLEKELAQDSEGFRKKANQWASLGYVMLYSYLFFLFLIFVVMVGFNVFLYEEHFANIKLMLVTVLVLGAIFSMLRWVFKAGTPPTGILLSAPDYPALHQCLAEIYELQGSKPFDAVYLNNAVNASAYFVPGRLGLFPGKNYLLLGYPLLVLLTPDELKAVLAHEAAHLNGAHGKFSYRLGLAYLTWQRILHTKFGKGSAKMMTRFTDWYLPKLQAYYLVASLQFEYQADKLAAACTSPALMGSALIKLGLCEPLLAKLPFAGLPTNPSQTAKLPENLVSVWLQNIAKLDYANGQSELEQLLAAPNDYLTLHPNLRLRLTSLGLKAPEASDLGTLSQDAQATSLLGSRADALVSALQQAVQLERGDNWQENYKMVQGMRTQYASPIKEPAGYEEYLFKAKLARSLDLKGEVETWLTKAEAVKAGGEVDQIRGELAIQRGEVEDGLALLKKAVDADAVLLIPAYGFYVQVATARGIPCDDVRQRLAIELAKVNTEVGRLGDISVLKPVTLEPKALAEIGALLVKASKVEKAYILAKPVAGLPASHWPLVLLVIGTKGVVTNAQLMIGGQLGQFGVRWITDTNASGWKQLKPLLPEPVFSKARPLFRVLAYVRYTVVAGAVLMVAVVLIVGPKYRDVEIGHPKKAALPSGVTYTPNLKKGATATELGDFHLDNGCTASLLRINRDSDNTRVFTAQLADNLQKKWNARNQVYTFVGQSEYDDNGSGFLLTTPDGRAHQYYVVRANDGWLVFTLTASPDQNEKAFAQFDQVVGQTMGFHALPTIKQRLNP